MTSHPGSTLLADSTLPRITIVTPALGHDEWLEATLRSVVYQDYPNLEFIVIEDGACAERRSILD